MSVDCIIQFEQVTNSIKHIDRNQKIIRIILKIADRTFH